MKSRTRSDGLLRFLVLVTWGVLIGGSIWVGFLILESRSIPVHSPTFQAQAITEVMKTQTSEQVVATSTKSPIPPSQTPMPPGPTQTPVLTRSATHTPSQTITVTILPYSVRPRVIGLSVAGRPLEVHRFGYGAHAKLIVAGIHGGYEWNTIALADELIAYLKEYPETVPTDTRLFILRALNPDGEARSKSFDGRANENGVDLNRNFPNLWQAEWSRDGCWSYGPITAGSGPASEPETQALMNFILTNDIEALISYHSAALGIFPGGQPPDPASLNLAETIASISNYPYPPIDIGCQFSGQLIDWASEHGIAAVDIELHNHQDTDFEENLVILARFLHWRH